MTLHSFAELKDEMKREHPDWKFKTSKPRNRKPIKCRICGTEMVHINNVWSCPGMKSVPDPTEKEPDRTKQVPCGNFIIEK